jgi:hypothetical protein
MKQERHLLLTNLYLSNLKKKRINFVPSFLFFQSSKEKFQ